MIFFHFQGKSFNITVIQAYVPTSNAEEAEAEQFYEDLQDLLEVTPQRDVLFLIGDWNAKVECQEKPGVTGISGLELKNDSILIFTILILPIHEHGIFLHLLVSSLIYFTSVL